VTHWLGADVAIGSNEPQPPLDRARFERLLQDDRLRAALVKLGLGTYEQAANLAFHGVPPRGRSDGLITDDRPSLEYFLTLPLLTRLSEGSPSGVLP